MYPIVIMIMIRPDRRQRHARTEDCLGDTAPTSCSRPASLQAKGNALVDKIKGKVQSRGDDGVCAALMLDTSEHSSGSSSGTCGGASLFTL